MIKAWHYSFKLRNPKLNPHLPRLHPGARGVDLRHRGFMLHVLVISSLAHVFPQLSGSRTCGPWQQIRGPLQWGTFPTGFPAGFGCVGYISERRGKRRFNYYFSSIKGLFEKKTGCFLLVSCFFSSIPFLSRAFFSFSRGRGGWTRTCTAFHPTTPKSSQKSWGDPPSWGDFPRKTKNGKMGLSVGWWKQIFTNEKLAGNHPKSINEKIGWL